MRFDKKFPVKCVLPKGLGYNLDVPISFDRVTEDTEVEVYATQGTKAFFKINGHPCHTTTHLLKLSPDDPRAKYCPTCKCYYLVESCPNCTA